MQNKIVKVKTEERWSVDDKWKLRLGLELQGMEENKNGLYASRSMTVVKSISAGAHHFFSLALPFFSFLPPFFPFFSFFPFFWAFS